MRAGFRRPEANETMTFTPKHLNEQVIVVTGASSGIGLATAREAAERGARVVLAARDGQALAEIVEGIEARGGHATAVTADVGSREQVDAIAAAAVRAYGGIDTWVNVAGQTIYGLLWEVEGADHAKLMQTNFWGTVYGSLTAVDHLRQRGGSLINVGSVASDIGLPMQGMYVASKHAVKGFTDCLRMELAQEHIPIAVTLVKPTSIDSPLPQRARNYMNREPSLPPPVYRPEEVAYAILRAAEHPKRDVYVGGSGKLLSVIGQAAPRLIDVITPLVTLAERRKEAPRDPIGALQAPVVAGRVRGDAPTPVRRTSTYMRASTHPLATAVVMLGAVSLAATVIARRGRR